MGTLGVTNDAHTNVRLSNYTNQNGKIRAFMPFVIQEPGTLHRFCQCLTPPLRSRPRAQPRIRPFVIVLQPLTCSYQRMWFTTSYGELLCPPPSAP